MVEPAAALRAAVADVAPGDLLRRAIAVLGELFQAEVQCWLADYQESVLLAAAGVSASAADPEVLRVYAAQVPSRRRRGDGLRLYWPLSVRGARCGVLELTLAPDSPDVGAEGGIADAVQALADALALVVPLTDAYETLRRVRPLTVAAEMQWAMLPPSTSYAEPAVQVAGSLEPAYSLSGDCFDFSRNGEWLDVAVFDGNGRGVTASMATTLTVSAYRNARRSGLSLGDQASMADQALFANFSGQHYVAATLMRLQVATGALLVVDAGSPMVLRLRERECTVLSVDAQLPLGMFEETVYVEQRLQLQPGDRLVVVGDGVHDARSTDDEPFSFQQLATAVRATELLNAAEAARHVIRSLHVHTAGAPLEGDAVALCLDWTPDESSDSHE